MKSAGMICQVPYDKGVPFPAGAAGGLSVTPLSYGT